MKSLLLSPVSWFFDDCDLVAAVVHIVEKLSKFLLGGARLNGMTIGRMKRSVVVRKSTCEKKSSSLRCVCAFVPCIYNLQIIL